MALKITCPHCGDHIRLEEPYPLPGSERRCRCGRALKVNYPVGRVETLRREGRRFASEGPDDAAAPDAPSLPQSFPPLGAGFSSPNPAATVPRRPTEAPDAPGRRIVGLTRRPDAPNRFNPATAQETDNADDHELTEVVSKSRSDSNWVGTGYDALLDGAGSPGRPTTARVALPSAPPFVPTLGSPSANGAPPPFSGGALPGRSSEQPVPNGKPPRRRHGSPPGAMGKLRRLVLGTLVFSTLAAGVAAVPLSNTARDWAAEGVAMADQHVRYEVSHPGWSFPARIYTAATPLTAPPKQLVVEAKARGYLEDCKDPGPGEFCAKSGTVVPRSGDTLEPVLLGWLIGPDSEVREHLPLAEAPKVLVDAILTAEDRAYYDHSGVNLKAMARAVLANAQEGGYAQGGSTLTMQVVRNLVQRREKTIDRKLREMVYAWAIDDHLGKDGVLQMYLDAPYLGQKGGLSICGFAAAARHYYDKDVRELTLDEAATLAAILPAPGKFAPDRFPERAKERRDRVLRGMAETKGYDVTAALAAPIVTVPPEAPVERWPAYLSATRAYLEGALPPETLYGAGLFVTTGLEVHAQEEAEKLFPSKTKYFESLVGKRGDGDLQAAGVLLDVETGLIRAVYGGSEVTSTSFNRATQARRQPGSSFKPLVYALAFSQKNPDGTSKYTASSTEINEPRTFKTPQGDWRPRNVGGEYSSTACLAQGLTWSQNIATASLLEEVGGPKALIPFATKLGFDTSKFPEEMGLALGQGEVTPLEMAQFAAIVSNGGRKVTGTPVLRAVDAAGVERIAPPQAGEAVLTPEAAALTRELMRLVIDVGTGGASRGAGGEAGYQGPALGKTGTTDSERDLWFVGATPTRAMSVWLGYDVPAPLGAAASDLAAPLWGWWMNRVTKFQGTAPLFSETPKITKRYVCTVSGKLSGASCRGINAPFLTDTAPKAGCSIVHPPPPEPVEGEELPKPGHESLWKRMAREKAEKDAAAGIIPPAGAAAPGAAPKPTPAPDAAPKAPGAAAPKPAKAPVPATPTP